MPKKTKHKKKARDKKLMRLAVPQGKLIGTVTKVVETYYGNIVTIQLTG